jgi:transmembrane sensor
VTETRPTTDSERFDAALAWHVRLEGDVGEDAWLAFAQWLEADPQNRVVFNQVDAVSHEITARLSSESLDDFSPVVIRPQAWQAAVSKRVWIPTALAAAILVAGYFQFFNAPGVQTFSTKVGEHRDVTLADGSVIHLNTDTALTASMGRNARDVRLEKGEAELEVAADAGRVFSVELDKRRVEVVGTAFNILRSEGRVSVAVEHGIVQVRQSAGAEAPVKLMPGDLYLSSEGSAEYQIAKVNPSAVAPWREGRLVFEDATLAQVASELNRYFTKTVVVDDETTGAMKFSGILKIDDEASVLRRLEAFVPITVQEKADTVVLTRGSSK